MSINSEKDTVEFMIRLYCRRVHNHGELCENCLQLLQYVHKRLNMCRFGDNKGSCKYCISHCYTPAKRENIRLVMRFCGPRMIFISPIKAILHLVHKRR